MRKTMSKPNERPSPLLSGLGGHIGANEGAILGAIGGIMGKSASKKAARRAAQREAHAAFDRSLVGVSDVIGTIEDRAAFEAVAAANSAALESLPREGFVEITVHERSVDAPEEWVEVPRGAKMEGALPILPYRNDGPGETG